MAPAPKTNPQFFNDGAPFSDIQLQQITQLLRELLLQDSAPALAPSTPALATSPPASANKDEEDEEQPFTSALTTSPSASANEDEEDEEQPSTPALTTSPSTPALIKSSLPLTLALTTSSLLPTSSLLTTSSRSSFAIYIKGQMARLNGIG
jgi:hypothetical protein